MSHPRSKRQIIAELGFADPDLFAEARKALNREMGEPDVLSRTGRTTLLVVELLEALSHGLPVRVVANSHTRRRTDLFYSMAKGYAQRLGLDVSLLTRARNERHWFLPDNTVIAHDHFDHS